MATIRFLDDAGDELVRLTAADVRFETADGPFGVLVTADGIPVAKTEEDEDHAAGTLMWTSVANSMGLLEPDDAGAADLPLILPDFVAPGILAADEFWFRTLIVE